MNSADFKSSWTDGQKQKYMDNVNLGVDSGGWDNDDYLNATKTRPVTTNIELLLQAEAYVRSCDERGMPVPQERKDFVDELRAGLSAEELATFEVENAAAIARVAAAEEAEKASKEAPVAPPPLAAPFSLALAQLLVRADEVVLVPVVREGADVHVERPGRQRRCRRLLGRLHLHVVDDLDGP